MRLCTFKRIKQRQFELGYFVVSGSASIASICVVDPSPPHTPLPLRLCCSIPPLFVPRRGFYISRDTRSGTQYVLRTYQAAGPLWVHREPSAEVADAAIATILSDDQGSCGVFLLSMIVHLALSLSLCLRNRNLFMVRVRCMPVSACSRSRCGAPQAVR